LNSFGITMRWPILIAVCLSAIALSSSAQTGTRDRYFTRFPFEKWKAEGPVSQIKWSPKPLPAKLSAHQRLITRIELVIDGKETEKRRDHGELVIFIEITDSANRHWRSHETFDLSRVPESAKGQQIFYAQDAFILPGEYKLAIAICDTRTQEHSFAERSLHVAPLRSDPLPDAWRDLPAVEFIRQFQPPDNWYQPYTRGRLRVALETHRRTHVDVLMNMTPSERVSGSVRVFRRNLTVLIPALKVLSGMSVPNGSMDVTLLDLTKQHAWEQRVGETLGGKFDWLKFREPLASTNPGIIDIQSLALKAEMLQFFRAQIAERLQSHGDKDEDRVVIVLSAPVFLEQQHKANAAPLEKDPHRRLFYIRDRPVPPARPGVTSFEGSAQPLANSIASDDCEGLVKSLGGRVYNVLGPEQFRKVLASILTDVAHM
jgi:hypothetical protein